MTSSRAPVDAAEWAALRSGAAFALREGSGILRLTGADVLDLLNRITTNKLEHLPPGETALTVLTNGDGRVIDLLTLVAMGDGFWCLTSAARGTTVAEWIDLYTFGEDLLIEDRTETGRLISLVGPGAPAVAAALGMPELPANRAAAVMLGGVPVVAARGMPGGADGFDLIVDATDAAEVIDALRRAGAVPVEEAAWDAHRIANGMPVYGAEFGEFNNPLESRLMGAISEDKGCYTGQEIIARLITYKKIQHRLMAAAAQGRPAPGTDLSAGGDPAGRLTSVALLPDGQVIALALVRSVHARPGALLQADDGAVATLSEPSFALVTEPVEA